MIFSLPFHVARFFRPTFLSVFELTNTGLGDVFAVFGVTATLAYFPGGLLADAFSARKIMTLSLFATALGGVYMAQFPGLLGLSVLFGYWGVTTILLFWAAMIKATRDWGGESKQGSAFGLLDGGRGLVAALVATGAVAVLTHVMPEDVVSASVDERTEALRSVILFYSATTFLAGIFVWMLVPETQGVQRQMSVSFSSAFALVKKKQVWLQAVIVVCAYCAYKGLDNFALYVVDVLGKNELEAARFTSYSAYLRVLAAIGAGFLANRISANRVITLMFSALIMTYLVLSLALPSEFGVLVIYGNILVTFCAVFALRGVYFALIGESAISPKETGAAVGLISLIGFTPDIFFTPLAGRILDASPGVQGHQMFFAVLVGIALVGLMMTLCLQHFVVKEKSKLSS